MLKSNLPTYVPECNQVANIGGIMETLSPADFEAQFPRVHASGTITLGGTVTENDEIHAKFSLASLPGGEVIKSVTAGGSDTLISLAQKLAAAICDDSTLQKFGAYATSLGAVVTVKWPGPLGNLVALEATVEGEETETSTVVALSGGSGPVIPEEDANLVYNGCPIQCQAGIPMRVDAGLAAAMVESKMKVY